LHLKRSNDEVQMFHARRITAPGELAEMHALRHQVYCHERGFLDPDDHLDGQERDEYDPSAIHIAAFDAGSAMVGGLRLVRSTSAQFPIFDHCKVDRRLFPRNESSLAFAEISRLIISKKKREQAHKSLRAQTEAAIGLRPQGSKSDFADLGLSSLLMDMFQAMFLCSKKRQIRYWFAAMEPSLLRLLKRFHFEFKPIGPPTDYYGQVIPCIASLDEIERHVTAHNAEFFRQFSKHLLDADSNGHETTLWPYRRHVSLTPRSGNPGGSGFAPLS
jgi:N-acyl amino acid synthase of PEP-CTERM/exosortase system